MRWGIRNRCVSPLSLEDYISQQDPRFKGIMDVEEFGVAWVRFENGGVMVFKISWAVHQDSLGSSFCLGKEMGISLNGPVVYADAYTDDLKKLVESEGLTAEANPPEGMTTIKFSGFPEVNVWEAQMTAFRKSVKADAPSAATAGRCLTHERDYGRYFPFACGR